MSLHFTSSTHQIDLIKLPLILKQINFLCTCTCISVPYLLLICIILEGSTYCAEYFLRIKFYIAYQFSCNEIVSSNERYLLNLGVEKSRSAEASWQGNNAVFCNNKQKNLAVNQRLVG